MTQEQINEFVEDYEAFVRKQGYTSAEIVDMYLGGLPRENLDEVLYQAKNKMEELFMEKWGSPEFREIAAFYMKAYRMDAFREICDKSVKRVPLYELHTNLVNYMRDAGYTDLIGEKYLQDCLDGISFYKRPTEFNYVNIWVDLNYKETMAVLDAAEKMYAEVNKKGFDIRKSESLILAFMKEFPGIEHFHPKVQERIAAFSDRMSRDMFTTGLFTGDIVTSKLDCYFSNTEWVYEQDEEKRNKIIEAITGYIQVADKNSYLSGLYYIEDVIRMDRMPDIFYQKEFNKIRDAIIQCSDISPDVYFNLLYRTSRSEVDNSQRLINKMEEYIRLGHAGYAEELSQLYMGLVAHPDFFRKDAEKIIIPEEFGRWCASHGDGYIRNVVRNKHSFEGRYWMVINHYDLLRNNFEEVERTKPVIVPFLQDLQKLSKSEIVSVLEDIPSTLPGRNLEVLYPHLEKELGNHPHKAIRTELGKLQKTIIKEQEKQKNKRKDVNPEP